MADRADSDQIAPFGPAALFAQAFLSEYEVVYSMYCFLVLLCSQIRSIITLVLLYPDIPCLANSVDPDQLIWIWICTVSYSTCEFISTI